MNKQLIISFLVLFFSIQSSFSQTDDKGSLSVDSKTFLEGSEEFNPLSPSRAAFLSAILPGLGQAYNKRYWKIPIVYGALATSLYFYTTNNNTLKDVRRTFRLRAAGEPTTDFELFSDQSLENAQNTLKRNRDTSLLIFIGLYALQVLEASIDAHLLQFNVSDKITFNPRLLQRQNSEQRYVGLSLNLNF